MSYTAKRLLEIAIAELGYKEKASNSQLDDKTANAGDKNWTKYARDLHTAGYYQAAKNGYAWCDMFVDWCFLQLGGSKEKGEWLECQTGLYGAGCTWSSDCYRWADRWGTEPKVGAQIFFAKNGKGSEEHTGIVEKFDNNYVYTIEGNASNMVKRKTYSRTSSYVLGYGYPRFDEKAETVEPAKPVEPTTRKDTCTVELPVLRKGDKCESVKALQILLLGYGYTMEGYGADSSFGGATRRAVEKYQKDNKLEVDGVVGPKTWGALLK